jgi:hypothetical protein
MTEETGAATPAIEPAVTPAESEQATPVDTGTPTEGAAQENAETPVEDDDDGADDGSTDKPRKLSHTKRLQRKVSYQAGELAAKDERIAYLESILNDAGKPEDAPQETGDFYKDEAAKTRWELKQELRESKREDARKELDFQKQARTAAAAKAITVYGEELAKQIPNYEEVVGSLQKIGGFSEPVREILLSNPEQGAKAAYFLGLQPDLAAAINRLPPTDAAFEIGQLLGRSSLPNPKIKTSAPPPLSTPKGAVAKPVDINALAKSDDMDGFIAMRRQQSKARA